MAVIVLGSRRVLRTPLQRLLMLLLLLQLLQGLQLLRRGSVVLHVVVRLAVRVLGVLRVRAVGALLLGDMLPLTLTLTLNLACLLGVIDRGPVLLQLLLLVVDLLLLALQLVHLLLVLELLEVLLKLRGLLGWKVHLLLLQ